GSGAVELGAQPGQGRRPVRGVRALERATGEHDRQLGRRGPGTGPDEATLGEAGEGGADLVGRDAGPGVLGAYQQRAAQKPSQQRAGIGGRGQLGAAGQQPGGEIALGVGPGRVGDRVGEGELPGHRATGLGDHLAYGVPVGLVGVGGGDQHDATAGELTPDHGRGDRRGDRVARAQVRLELRTAAAELVDLAVEAVAVAGHRRQHPLADVRRAEDEPERERQEDRRHRDDVVPERHHLNHPVAIWTTDSTARSVWPSAAGPTGVTASAATNTSSTATMSTATAPAVTGVRCSAAADFASTTSPPTFRRVRNVEALRPWRLRSRNSVRVAWYPTVTISPAPWWWASSSARSSVLPEAGN